MPTGAALDPRRNAYRRDLAASSLRGQVEASRFTDGDVQQVARMRLPVRRAPDPAAALDTEALLGESFVVLDDADGWSWGQLVQDGYVGYVPSDGLAQPASPPTHRVTATLAMVYVEPNALSEPLMRAPFNAQLTIADMSDDFARLETGGFVGRHQIVPIGEFDNDYVAAACRFVGAPYLYGGKTAIGIDCSGLVQIVLRAAGIAAPRDSDMQQEEVLPTVVIGADLAGLQRGDLVFWPGHVGIMLDAITMVHTSATNMCVAIEPVCDVAERSRKGGPAIASVSRPVAPK